MTNKPNAHPGATPATTQTHIYILLDRSGSMESIRNDVIGGFNRFLTEQQADGPDARLTFVQFDSENPAELLVDAIPIREAVGLTAEAFVPRGSTPLLDATGRLLARADERAATLASVGFPAEDVVFVTVTDGEENASREFRHKDILRMVAKREKLGWTFVFLSAGLDAYGEAGGLGYDQRSVRAWAPTSAGTAEAFTSLSTATKGRRASRRSGHTVDTGDFFGTDAPAARSRPDPS